nr:MAG TPA: hypothetical protein [Caudoviricetes sp.]
MLMLFFLIDNLRLSKFNYYFIDQINYNSK